MYSVKVSENDKFSKVQQIVNFMVNDIENGVLKTGQKLPSINQFADKNSVARDTIEKAYRQLRNRGYVVASPGRGYFVQRTGEKQLRVLLIFNKLSSFKKIIYDSFLQGLGNKARVDLHIHHYNPKLLKEILEANLGKYDFYAIMPHFFAHTDPKEYTDILKLIPQQELIVIDKNVPQLTFPHRAVYQDFRSDIYEALISSDSLLKKYKSLTLVFPEIIHHPKEIIQGISAFCNEKKMTFYMTGCIGDEKLRKRTVYIVTEEDDLARLLKKTRQSGLTLGTDIGIISFNETVFKELLDITVVTTDFQEMGRTAARLILNKGCVQFKNPFRVITRKSL